MIVEPTNSRRTPRRVNSIPLGIDIRIRVDGVHEVANLALTNDRCDGMPL